MAFLHIIIIVCALALTAPAAAQDTAPCAATDTACLLDTLETLTARIDEPRWQDQTYRELAKLLAQSGQTDRAIALVDRISNPDTRAMTVRGIGMAAAERDLSQEEYNNIFKSLHKKARTIDHAPSYAIALTYIAMAQAFAGDDEGATATAAGMENDALRNKAYAESAEIQAERGDLSAAMASIAAIDDAAFRNKAHGLVAEIFADDGNYDEALNAAMAIENTYQQARAVLYILAKQMTPEEVSLVE